ncbi:MAG: EF-P lysine aminoacylase EpmA [Polyangia bacterium]
MSERTRHEPYDRRRLASLRERLEARARIFAAIRDWFATNGFLEVETPIRIPAPAPEIHIDAEPCGDRYLIASPELQMKRLLAAGYERIFQICRCFRRGERGDRHLPEFTMLEWYRAGGGPRDLMRDCEELLHAGAEATGSFPLVERYGFRIDLSAPFERIEVAGAFERAAGWRPGADPDPSRFERDLVERVEPSLPADRPVFLDRYPAAMASLARICPEEPDTAERFELYAGGLELANGFGELTDPAEQRGRFVAERTARKKAGKDVYPLDERFLAALELGLAPCAGIALGLDRLVMLLTCAESIDEVVAFPEGTA